MFRMEEKKIMLILLILRIPVQTTLNSSGEKHDGRHGNL